MQGSDYDPPETDISIFFPKSPTADIVLRTAFRPAAPHERRVFFVTKALLSRISPVFRDMLDIGDEQDEPPAPAESRKRQRVGDKPQASSQEHATRSGQARRFIRRAAPQTVMADLPLVELPDTRNGISLLLRLHGSDPEKLPNLENAAAISYREILELYDTAHKYEAYLVAQHADMVLRCAAA